MTDKKEMSVNESLAKANKILRSTGDLILPRETNIALSILADVACQQQEEIDGLRESISLSDRFISGLNKHVQSQPQGYEPETLIPLGTIAAELLLAINEFGHTPISHKTVTRARELFSNIENQAKALINENETLRNAAKHEERHLTVTSNRIAMNGGINITHGTTADNAIPNQNNSGRSKYGCIRVEDKDLRALIPANFITAVVESKSDFDFIDIHIAGGEILTVGCSYEEVTKLLLEYLGRERGTINNPAGV